MTSLRLKFLLRADSRQTFDQSQSQKPDFGLLLYITHTQARK
jgi:hypothetical protein